MSRRVRPANAPIREDDAFIAKALESASIPTLMLSLVHITGRGLMSPLVKQESSVDHSPPKLATRTLNAHRPPAHLLRRLSHDIYPGGRAG